MSTVYEIEQSLFEFAPHTLAMEWDNVGHLIGNPKRDVSKVLVSLDVSEDVADEAIDKGCELIVAHHPIINCKWLPVQSIREDMPQGHLLRKLIYHDVSVICMHTNLDIAAGGVNDVLAEKLHLLDYGPFTAQGVGRCGHLETPIALPYFVQCICRILHCSGIRYADAGRHVYQVAVGGGACGDFEDDAIAAGCDTFVTSDLTYHQFLDAKGKGINLIDAGHFPTEDPVCETLVSYLSQRFPCIQIEKSASHHDAIKYYTEGD